MRHPTLRAITFIVALGAVPAWAHTAGSNGNASPTPPPAGQKAAQAQTVNKPVIGTATINPTGIPPSQRNPLLTDSGAVRISKLVGAAIFNKNDKKIGSVEDVLAGQDGKLQAVIATGNKKVAVPWNKLVFGDAKLNSNDTVMIPGGTQQGLNKLPPFSYHHQNKKG